MVRNFKMVAIFRIVAIFKMAAFSIMCLTVNSFHKVTAVQDQVTAIISHQERSELIRY